MGGGCDRGVVCGCVGGVWKRVCGGRGECGGGCEAWGGGGCGRTGVCERLGGVVVGGGL